MLDHSSINHIASREGKLFNKLDDLQSEAMSTYPELSRFSVAVIGEQHVSNYYVHDALVDKGRYDFKQDKLQDSSQLAAIAFSAQTRTIRDMQQMVQTKRIKELVRIGHRSSYTFPISHRGKTLGFVFLNAQQAAFFDRKEVVGDMAFFCQSVANLFVQLFQQQEHFRTSLAVALKMGHARDPETSEHLKRMGIYSELIARYLSVLSSEVTHQFIHRIGLYAPYHDIGKYLIPDEILYSDKRFNEQERLIMNRHTLYGEEIIEQVVSLSGADIVSEEEIRFIKNIVRHHHEHYDGSGLPDALAFEDIPLEARIVTLADVFDALLSRRAYKPAWPINQVIDYIHEYTSKMFDPLCVEVLLENLEEFLSIRAKYVDSSASENMLAS
ncbi:HD-GYP domain-containing protein [Vibrio sinaloensis]|uniref:HD-GYP domain-containing protein n=1 Tax=Photobacterium sp. (strain ATCC 43367) TaxID=379097 RepID=UPI0035E54A4C